VAIVNKTTASAFASQEFLAELRRLEGVTTLIVTGVRRLSGPFFYNYLLLIMEDE
jgi:hypothetical protein